MAYSLWQGLDAVKPEGGLHERVPAQLHAPGERVAAAAVTGRAQAALMPSELTPQRYRVRCTLYYRQFYGPRRKGVTINIPLLITS